MQMIAYGGPDDDR